MRLLLDTHVLLWFLDDPFLIAASARVEIANARNAVYVSAVTIQEIVIKQNQNRLTCPEPLLPLLDENRLLRLPVTLDHALALRSLPLLHKDPFDRQLAAQCLSDKMTLVTRDPMLAKYDIAVLEA